LPGHNETHWGSQPGGAAANRIILEAIAATDPAKAAELWHEVQTAVYTDGGTLMYADADYLDACAPNIEGLKTTLAGNLNIGRLLDGWISK
jgi:hypothetical protein